MIYLCPSCKNETLKKNTHNYTCNDETECVAKFPIFNGIPILIDPGKSLFTHDDYLQNEGVTTMDLREKKKGIIQYCKDAIKAVIPDKSLSICDFDIEDAIEHVKPYCENPKVLVIGAGDVVIEPIAGVNICYSDVALGAGTDVIADGHDLPFQNGIFDMVIIVAVLEHVLRPQQVVMEVERVLNADGFVYSSTPFMQQVHMGRYDFTRFTELGHRYLWRQFSEVKSGVGNGVGMVLTWSIEYYWRTVFTNSKLESIACYLARFFSFPFLMSDYLLRKKRGVYDGASGFYFFGQKSKVALTDRELVASYKGKQ